MNAETYAWSCQGCGSYNELSSAGGSLSCQCGSLHEIVVTKLGTIESSRP